MADRFKVTLNRLKRVCDEGIFDFKTTEKLSPLEGIIGQDRAVRAMEFGLKIKSHGYNIFMTGVTGTGKSSYAKSCVKDIAKNEPVPDDWCYVFNFENPGRPAALKFPPGKGKIFCRDMELLVEELKVELPKAFEGEGYEKEKAEIIKEFQIQRSQLMEELSKKAADMNFVLKRTPTGFVTIPVIEDKQITQEEFDELDTEIREDLEKKMNEIQLKSMEVTRKILTVEKEIKDKLKQLEQKIGLFAAGHLIEDLKDKYREIVKVVNYLEAVKEDVLENLDEFRSGSTDQATFPWMKKSMPVEERYQVNLLVGHQENSGAPVIIEKNPTYYNLVGKAEYESQFGMLITSFNMIKPGALHLANGGYLILQAVDLFSNFQSWDVLKRVLKNKELQIENIQEQIGLVSMSTLRPEPIPINVKVIVIGSPRIYNILYHYEEDFRKLFKIKVDFDVEMERSNDNVMLMGNFISGQCRQEGLRHFDRSAVARVIEYGSRLAGHQEKISTRFNDLIEIIHEADAWAGYDNAAVVSSKHVKKAFEEKVYRSNKIEKKIQELFREEQVLIDVEGEKVGQVNALSVIDMGDYSFGRPNRITAETHLGRSGVVNIEREAKMSGRIHDKGVLILSGYLASKYAQDIPLTLTATLTFEQLYSGVEGDSASSTELYALLSSLSGVPLRQDIAVTGSVNQKGEIQPVGGVNEKIEGFYGICKIKGLTGRQGVIIPYQNIKNLMLSDEVIEAADRGKFHIYGIKNIEEGMEILTGMPAGERKEDGSYPEKTLNYLVDKKLRRYNKAISKHSKSKEDQERE